MGVGAVPGAAVGTGTAAAAGGTQEAPGPAGSWGTEEVVLRGHTDSPQGSPELAQPSWAYWKDKSTQPPRSGGGLFHMLSPEDPQGSREKG